MSRIKEMVETIEASKGFEEQKDSKKISVTGKLNEEQVFRLDFVAKKLGMTRSAFAYQLLTEGCLEAAEVLGVDLPEFQALYMAERFKKPVEECREMLNQTGIKEAK